ncbi:MAG: hypothetical protein A3H98_12255 [Bacteroidetes bacterium RIFCSPLOWO2_02_FULL_36_8]|nr:MAG: hypothetical protein A3H98_12255 [Bacteroidetes bacterium RIFCSPLOWO2_02_FULL_36_8]OFY69849.1 MAG: hypothetical protein A3G23_07450 [Bacteroidetes bacterium RIFCSPLOWO2_12_FULL_37_12]
MKKFHSLLVALFILSGLLAQVPESFKYQAVVRDVNGNPLPADSIIGMRISVTLSNGDTVCVEEFKPKTNQYGLVNLEIGSVNPSAFSAIDWKLGPYFLKIELDPAGGTNYTVMGTSQLLSVPYALYAKTSGTTSAGGSIVWQGTLTTAPLNPVTNWAYYNSTDKKSYLWDGDSWEIIAQDGRFNDGGRLNVKDFGAKGDGFTDDTYAIQAALDTGILLNRPVYIPAGTYITSSPLQVDSYQNIIGDGQYMTIIQNLSTDGLKKKNGVSTVHRVTIQGIQLQTANDGANTKIGIDATAFTYSRFIDIHIRFYETGILLRRGPSAEPNWFNSFRDITIFVCKNGINIDDNGYSVNTCLFENIIIEDVGQWTGGNGIIISGYGHCITGLYVGIPNGNAAIKFLTTAGNNVLIRIYGESSMTYLIDLGTPTPGSKNTLIAPHVDSLSMLLTSIPGYPDFIIIPTY